MILYTIGIFLFGIIIRVAALFDAKAAKWVRGRKDLFRRLEGINKEGRPLVWIHVSSLGEFEQGRPVIEKLKKKYPDHFILLTFFSPSGYELRKNYEGVDSVMYMPLDTPRNARRFIEAIDPAVTIFIKYEYWLNHLRVLRNKGIKTYIISAIYREDSVFFKWYGGLFRDALRGFELIFVQNSGSVHLLKKLGLSNVIVAGDTRFDRVTEILSDNKQLPVLEQFCSEGAVLVAGSTWPEDEELLRSTFDRLDGFRLVIAPHEIGRDRVSDLKSKFGDQAICYTEINSYDQLNGKQILIIDTIGMLSYIYRYSEFVYIGGGFGVGIHNVLEPAVYGRPIAFGPNYKRFREACDLVKLKCAMPVSGQEDLAEWINFLVRDSITYENVCRDAATYVKDNTGATNIIITKIFSSSTTGNS